MKMKTRPLLCMIEEQGSIIDMRETTAKGIWKSRLNWPMTGRVGEREERGKNRDPGVEPRAELRRESRECVAKMAELYRN